jgi:hypothetical protein
LRPETYRGGTAKTDKRVSDGTPFRQQAQDDAVPVLDRTPEEIAESSSWTLVEAQRVKEIYLALLRKQEFEVERRELVEIEESALGQIGEQTFLISLECSVRAKTVALPGRREILMLRSRVIGINVGALTAPLKRLALLAGRLLDAAPFASAPAYR